LPINFDIIMHVYLKIHRYVFLKNTNNFLIWNDVLRVSSAARFCSPEQIIKITSKHCHCWQVTVQ